MRETLTAQLDYVYFVYGLALVLLGAVAVSIARSRPDRQPWGWLAAFAFIHGIAEWLYIGLIDGAETSALRASVAGLLLLSYLFLLEFARRSQAAVRGSAPGAWTTAVFAILPFGLAVGMGIAAFEPAMRILVALPATLWTVATLTAASRKRGRGLNWAALFVGAYGIVAGLVVPDAPFVPDWWPTTRTFLQSTGIPVQLVRAAAVCGAAVSIWAYATSVDTPGRVARKRWQYFWGTLGILFAVLAGGWFLTDRLGTTHDRDLAEEAAAAAAQAQDHLVGEIEEAEEVARTVARLLSRLGLADALHAGGSRTRIDEVVEAVAGSAHGRAVHVLDPSGARISSSERRSVQFPGEAVTQLPVFRAAAAGRPATALGSGLSAPRHAILVAEPVTDGAGRIPGVVLVEKRIAPSSLGPQGSGSTYLVGADGQVLLAGNAGNAGRALWPAGDPARQHEAGREPILGAPLHVGTEWVRAGGSRQVAVRIPLPAIGASVVTLRTESMREPNRLLGIVIALLLGLVVVGSFVLHQTQLATESRLAQRHLEAEGRARQLARRADTDALTGIANRQGFNDAMAREFARARRFRNPLSILLADLDHFKQVNDRYGHPVGDQVLVGVAHLLAIRVRESDLVARWGGEEFVVIASMTDAEGATRLAEKLRVLVETSHIGPGEGATVSFGVAELRPEDTVESLVQRADAALYEAKRRGRNQVRCAESWVDMGIVAVAELQSGRAREPGTAPCVETHFAPIDSEHRAITEGLENLASLVDRGDPAEVCPVLESLVLGLDDHFAHEEGLMRRFGYPHRSRHEEAHRHLLADAHRFQGELEMNGLTPAFRQWAVVRLPEWLRYHVLAHDVALGKFLVGATEEGQQLQVARA